MEEIYNKFHFSDHLSIKNELIKKIYMSEHKKNFEDISVTDWDIENDNFDKEWIKLFLDNYYKKIKYIYNKIGFKKIEIENIWFQEYHYESGFDWHNHVGADFANVFFLNFSENNPGTEFKINDKIIKADVREGDIIIFPANILHRSPPNLSNDKRIIIAFNVKAR